MSEDSRELEVLEGDFTTSDFENISDKVILGSLSTEPDEYLMGGISNSAVVGAYDSKSDSLSSTVENTHIHGDINAKNLFQSASNSVASGGNITTESALIGGENSLIIGDNVDITRGEFGRRVRNTGNERDGNVIAGRDVSIGPDRLDRLKWSLQELSPRNDLDKGLIDSVRDIPESIDQSFMYLLGAESKSADGKRHLFNTVESTTDGMPIITEGEHPDEGITQFYGDWDQLSEYLIENVPKGAFEPFRVFNLPDQVQSVDELHQTLTFANEKYPEIESNVETVEDALDSFNLPELEGSNQEIYERIRDFDGIDERQNGLSFEAYDDPAIEDIIFEMSNYNDGVVRSSIDDSLDNIRDAIEEGDFGPEARVSFDFLDAPEIEDAEELAYELKARQIIGEEVGEAYKFLEDFSDLLELKTPPWKANSFGSYIKKSIFGGEDEERKGIYTWLKQIDEEYDFHKLRDRKRLLNKTSQSRKGFSLDYELSGSTEERHQQLLNLEDELVEHVNDNWDLGDKASEILEESNTGYILRNIDQISSYHEDGLEDFLLEFKGGKPEDVLEPGHQSTKYVDGDKALDSKEEVTEAAYTEGLAFLKRLSREQGDFSVSSPEIAEMEEELERINDEISNSQGKPPKNLIQEKNELKSKIPEKRREIAFEEVGLQYGDLAEYSELEPMELRKALDQFGQEYLESEDTHPESGEINPETTAGQARKLANKIDISDNVGNGYVDFEVYDKDILDLPSDDRDVPCSFPGGSSDKSFIGYMEDPGTQIALLESGNDEGAVIYHPVEHEDEENLLVHSVESDDGLTSRNDLSEAIRNQIEEYAHEVDMNGVIYSTSTHNTAAQDVIEAALEEDPEFQEETYTVDKKGREDVHLDFNLPEVQGYKVDIDR